MKTIKILSVFFFVLNFATEAFGNGECSANVSMISSDRESETSWNFLFQIDVSDCNNSDGDFDYVFDITEKNGSTNNISRSVSWRSENTEHTIFIDDGYDNLSKGDEISNESVDSNSIECRCNDE